MQTAQGNMLQSLRKVQQFLEDNATALGTVIQTGARRRLDDLIGVLSTHATVQTGSLIQAQSSSKEQGTLRRVLLEDYMSPIARIAKADLPNTPGIEPLRMPKGRLANEKLAAAAYGMAKAAAPFGPVFIAAGLPDNFVAQLNKAADDMLAAGDNRAQHTGKRRGATTGLAAQLSEGRKVVHILDAFVRTALKHDQALLSNWNQIKRVQRVSQSNVTPSASGGGTQAPVSGGA